MSEKKQADFTDLNGIEVANIVINTAIVAKQSGHRVVVANTTYQGEQGMFVWIPGYTHNGREIERVAVVAKSEGD